MLGCQTKLAGKKVALIGRSNLVGMPLFLLLTSYNAHVTLLFSEHTQDDIRQAVETSDIVIAACGRPSIVQAEWLKQDAIVVDVGINFVEVPGNSKKVIAGDVEFNETTLQRCS